VQLGGYKIMTRAELNLITNKIPCPLDFELSFDW